MWNLIIGGILGFGASRLLDSDGKKKSKKYSAKDKEDIKYYQEYIEELEKFRPYQEKVKDDINNEGFDYSFREYSSYDELDSKRFHTLRKKYVATANAIEKYVDSKKGEKLIDEKYDISVKDVIDKEGFDNALLTYHDWKDIKDPNFKKLLTQYKRSAKALAKHLNYKIV